MDITLEDLTHLRTINRGTVTESRTFTLATLALASISTTLNEAIYRADIAHDGHSPLDRGMTAVVDNVMSQIQRALDQEALRLILDREEPRDWFVRTVYATHSNQVGIHLYHARKCNQDEALRRAAQDLAANKKRSVGYVISITARQRAE